jgi:hypothetical protein
MKILAYCFNSANQQKPIIKAVESLFFWENKECNHKVTKENILKCLGSSEGRLRLDSKNKLIKSSENCTLDYYVDFIKISY